MKKHNFSSLLVFFTVLMIAGCDRLTFINENQPPKNDETVLVVTPVDDPQLAKLILKPNPKSIEIPRDPFKPIAGKLKSVGLEEKKVAPIREQFTDVYFLGMVKMEDSSVALLRVSEKKLMLKLNEQYRGFLVKEISGLQIVFSDGESQITIKRGIKK